MLAGRDMADLEATAADARNRGAAQATTVPFDARDPETFAPVLAGRR